MPDMKLPTLGTNDYNFVSSMSMGLGYDQKGLPFICITLNGVIYVFSEMAANDLSNALNEHITMLKGFNSINKEIK